MVYNLDEKIMNELDEKLDQIVNKLCDKYQKEIGPEIWMCFQQFAIDLALKANIDEHNMLIAISTMFRCLSDSERSDASLKYYSNQNISKLN